MEGSLFPVPSSTTLFHYVFTDDGIIRPVTFWVVGDFDQPSGRQLLYDAIRHMVRRPYGRKD